MALRVTIYEEPVLRKKGKPITRFDGELGELIREMINTMYEESGIGLAAQQIGRALQLCVIDVRGCDDDFFYQLDGRQPPLELFMPMAVINPELEVLPGKETTYEEGCLSFPEVRGDVKRPDAVRLKFQDAGGASHLLECTGILSRCVQHEVDHLNGVLFIDRMDKKTLRKLDKRLKQLKEQTRAAGAARPSRL